MSKKALGLVSTFAVAALAFTGCSTASAGGQAANDGFRPSGDVKMVVPFSAGGGSDLSGRAIAAGLESGTGLNVTTENKEGGSGAVGYSYFLSQKGKDNFLLASETALLALPITQDVQFSYESFTPIMKLGEDFTLLVVEPDSPYKTCAEVVDAAKNERVVAAVSGATSLDQVVFTLVEQEKDVKFDRVPFESGSEVVTALLGGQVDVISVNPGEILGQLEGGSLKALCAFADQRYAYDALKNIPTAKEQGIDVAFAQFRGFIAPGGISEDAKKFWIEQGKKYAETPEYTKYIEDNMLQPRAAYGDEFTAYLEGNSKDLESVLSK